MKGVIYARYSSDNQREESIEGQIRECIEFAKRNDITILHSYIDRAYSAKTDNRPEFQRMMKDSAKGLFDVVLVWKLDRFARNRYDSAHNKSILKKNGVKVISAREAIAEDSSGILLESVLEGYAEFYSAELSEKVIRGMTENALKCKYNGGGLPIGYMLDSDNCYQVDPLKAPAVLEAFKQYAAGTTVKQIVESMNNLGMTSGYNKPMSINSVTRMLNNRKYIGEYKFRDVVVPDGIPCIVPQDIFDRVQERLAKNKKAPARFKAAEERYLLTTKLFCKKCGTYMVGESGTSHTGKIHQYYKCVTAKKKKGCKKKTVKKDWIEDIVIWLIRTILFDNTLLERIAEKAEAVQKQENTALPMMKRQLAETEKAIGNLLDAIQQGLFTASTRQRLDELEENKSGLEINILQEEMQKPIITKEKMLCFFEQLRVLDMTQPEQRQRLVDIFLNAIYLDDDHLEIYFNYMEGAKTITFDEIKSSDMSPRGRPKKLLIYGLTKPNRGLFVLSETNTKSPIWPSSTKSSTNGCYADSSSFSASSTGFSASLGSSSESA